ncbi:hypothetical protein NC653_023022 [Populus alba x Populus x berolinensis]|uniref:Uncharacterized protein n=1 Tax=Populus alba x Populus x berolinensis TaxID=444605 RepID=A0AAD6QAD1_9ROSI|nr:hypothetical protein NC653_023022 [Populus alba x Populus x berolinensis]
MAFSPTRSSACFTICVETVFLCQIKGLGTKSRKPLVSDYTPLMLVMLTLLSN